MTRTSFVFIVAVLMLGISMPAFAETKKAPVADGGDAMRKAIITKVDTDKDGFISAAENRAAAVERFKVIDLNKDGSMTAGEASKAAEEFAKNNNKDKKIADRRAKILERQVISMDADKDGKVSQAEYTGRIEALFAEQDGNKDGKVNAAEMKEYNAKKFAQMRAKMEEARKNAPKPAADKKN